MKNEEKLLVVKVCIVGAVWWIAAMMSILCRTSFMSDLLKGAFLWITITLGTSYITIQIVDHKMRRKKNEKD